MNLWPCSVYMSACLISDPSDWISIELIDVVEITISLAEYI